MNKTENSQVHQIQKNLLKFLKHVVLFPIYLMTGCGNVFVNGQVLEVHDHTNKKMVGNKTYDEKQHGEISNWLDEGDLIPGLPTTTDGKKPVHRHNGHNLAEPHEFTNE